MTKGQLLIGCKHREGRGGAGRGGAVSAADHQNIIDKNKESLQSSIIDAGSEKWIRLMSGIYRRGRDHVFIMNTSEKAALSVPVVLV